jgi:hypothetical protein
MATSRACASIASAETPVRAQNPRRVAPPFVESHMKRTLSSVPLILAAALMLAACATPDRIPAGQSEADVRQRFGTPTAEVSIAGGKRLQYVNPPFGQVGYMIDLDTNGRVMRAEQVMDDKHFGQLQVGQDTMATVQRDFGPPSKIVRYMSTGNSPVWTYKYLQSGVWPMLMGVYFDEKGVVRRLETGPDPDFDRGNDRAR